MGGFFCHFLAELRILLFPLFRGDATFGSHGLGGGFVDKGLNLLFCFGQQTSYLPCELQRGVGGTGGSWEDTYVVRDSFHQFRSFGVREDSLVRCGWRDARR